MVGMVKELCEECFVVKVMFDIVFGVFGYDLFDVCVNGSAECLNLTVVF